MEVERFAAVIARARVIWAVCLAAATAVASLMVPERWYLLFLIPFGFVTYFITITIAAIYLSAIDDPATAAKVKELNRRLDEGTLEPGPELFKLLQEAGLGELTLVEGISPEVIGRYDGHQLYAWVDVRDPRTKVLHRYTYYGPALYSEHGLKGLIPNDPTKVFVNVGDVIYEREC